MARRLKATSVEGKLKAVTDGTSPYPAPPGMGKKAARYWVKVMRAKARDEWTDYQLEVAVDLTRVLVQLDTEQNHLIKEGGVIQGATGPKRNPRLVNIGQLRGERVRLERHLRIHANAVAEHPTQAKGRREAEEAGRRMVGLIADENSPFLPFGPGKAN
jgi:hypothetical protein